MSVQTFVPNSKISMTDTAVKHMLSKLKEHDNAAGIRVATKPSGCSGFMYILDIVTEPAATDVAVQINDDLTVYIDPESLPIVEGTTIDYVKEGLNSIVQFKNPNATGECGCGESFTVN